MSFIAVQGSSGVRLVKEKAQQNSSGVPEWENVGPDVFPGDKTCRVMAFSPDGDLFAWSNTQSVQVVKLDDAGNKWQLQSTIDHPKVVFIAFSPKGSVIVTWEMFAVKAGENAEQKNNLKLWNPLTGQLLAEFRQKKGNIWAPQWSSDEKLCAMRSPNNEINFYRDNDFSTVDKRLSLSKMDSFSLSPSSKTAFHVICFVPGQKGGPGFGKLFTYPNFNAERDMVASKSFFQADNMEVEWSHDGSMALLLTQSEVDKTGGSYYGKQQLHFISALGDTAMVQLAKEGPIYSIAWSPKTAEFCVVYGYMPAKATLFNHKCDKVFDFGTGPRNMALYNPIGNLLMLGGFGNLRGNIEIWSLGDKKKVSQFEASDSTDIKWSPYGSRIMTATCAPRLRQGNGYKIWHYTGSLLHEDLILSSSTNEELHEVKWQNVPALRKPSNFPIQYSPVPGITPKQPVASKQAYRPPGMRNKPSTFKLHDDDEPAENQKSAGSENLSKSAAKNKKRRENARLKKTQDTSVNNVGSNNDQVPKGVSNQAQTLVVSGDPEKNKKLRKLNEKLQQIEKLKKQQHEGKELELNQLEKLKREQEIVDEINKLKL